MRRLLSRRHVLGLLWSTALSTTLGRPGLGAPLDQGIGGTGVTFDPKDESDRGIGGTGVIGTIRKFGSIIVNDLRIAYPPDAVVRIDGQPATAADLKIGQVVRVAAAGQTGALSTRAIDVTSEVVGPVERTGPKQMVVLGQNVSTAILKRRAFEVGDTVAVSGLRRNDGTIVASLIEPRPGAPSRVAGPVTLGSDGSLRIGGLPLAGVDPGLIGRRAVLDGEKSGDRFAVTRGTSEAALLPPTIHTLSVESYVERRNGGLSLGSGLIVSDPKNIAIPAGKSVRAVLTTSVSQDGRLTVNRVQSGGRTYGGGTGGGSGSGNGPGGTGGGRGGTLPTSKPIGGDRGDDSGSRIPMDFGRGSGGGNLGGGNIGGGNIGGGNIGGGGIGGGGIGGGGMGGPGIGGGGIGGGGGPGIGGGLLGGGRR